MINKLKTPTWGVNSKIPDNSFNTYLPRVNGEISSFNLTASFKILQSGINSVYEEISANKDVLSNNNIPYASLTISNTGIDDSFVILTRDQMLIELGVLEPITKSYVDNADKVLQDQIDDLVVGDIFVDTSLVLNTDLNVPGANQLEINTNVETRLKSQETGGNAIFKTGETVNDLSIEKIDITDTILPTKKKVVSLVNQAIQDNLDLASAGLEISKAYVDEGDLAIEQLANSRVPEVAGIVGVTDISTIYNNGSNLTLSVNTTTYEGPSLLINVEGASLITNDFKPFPPTLPAHITTKSYVDTQNLSLINTDNILQANIDKKVSIDSTFGNYSYMLGFQDNGIQISTRNLFTNSSSYLLLDGRTPQSFNSINSGTELVPTTATRPMDLINKNDLEKSTQGTIIYEGRVTMPSQSFDISTFSDVELYVTEFEGVDMFVLTPYAPIKKFNKIISLNSFYTFGETLGGVVWSTLENDGNTLIISPVEPNDTTPPINFSILLIGKGVGTPVVFSKPTTTQTKTIKPKIPLTINKRVPKKVRKVNEGKIIW